MRRRYYAVLVGDRPGVFEVVEDGVGSHTTPLVVEHDSEDAARAAVTAFGPCVPGHSICVVYADGACSRNGKKNAVAGVGVYWGRDDARNVSRAARGVPTNNVAELEAVQDVLVQLATELAREDAIEYRIATDSEYVINSITKWGRAWARNGWKLASGKPVANVDLVRDVLHRFWDIESRYGGRCKLWHVRGHAGIAGNVEADKLAVAGKSAVPCGK